MLRREGVCDAGHGDGDGDGGGDSRGDGGIGEGDHCGGGRADGGGAEEGGDGGGNNGRGGGGIVEQLVHLEEGESDDAEVALVAGEPLSGVGRVDVGVKGRVTRERFAALRTVGHGRGIVAAVAAVAGGRLK